MINKAANGVCFITFELFDRAGLKHGFSTRHGGVSDGIYKSMNLSFHRGDVYEKVVENHRLFAKAVGYDPEDTVFSNQIHETKIVTVHEEDKGKGMYGKPGFAGVDGLVTDIPGIPLMTMYADCVPLMFYDPVKKVIGMAHSGWRGTVAGIGGIMVKYMTDHFLCMPEDILAVIGPSICVDCYEVSGDVAEEFYKVFSEDEAKEILIGKESDSENPGNSGDDPAGNDGTELIGSDIKNRKFQLNLWKANEFILRNAGILKEHLELPTICTCHNPDLMISHRQTGGKRGNMAAVMVL